MAAEAQAPYDLGTMCTVFMDTELSHAAARGVPLPDLAAGLAYSIARNYLEKVVSGRPVGRNVVFQGGVASNASVGGAQTLYTAFNHLDLFAWVAAFSGGYPVMPGVAIDVAPPPNAASLRGPTMIVSTSATSM